MTPDPLMLSDRPDLKLTYDDLEALRDDRRRHEIIDGEHFVTPVPPTRHQALSVCLSYRISEYLETNPIGEVYAAPFDVVLSEHDVVEPDLLIVLRENLDRLTSAHLKGAPDIAVEILSESTRKTDEVTKRRLYERFGVNEYWVVDPDIETIRIYSHAGAGYGAARELSMERGDVLASPLLPGFEVRLDKVFG
jgi:Uma2 family endonuclease